MIRNISVSIAPIGSLNKMSKSITSVPLSILNEALLAGMNTVNVCFVTDEDYRYFVKKSAMLKRRKPKTQSVVRGVKPCDM